MSLGTRASWFILAREHEGGEGALTFASTYSNLVSAVIVTDWMPSPGSASPTETAAAVDGIPVYVTGDASHHGIGAIDILAAALKERADGYSLTKYTRFVSAPGAADPLYRDTDGHSSDIAYR